MANFNKLSILLVLIVVIGVCNAEPPRYRLRPNRPSRIQQQRPFLSRQEAAPPAPAPYPSADDLKPAIPFDEGEQPDQVYGPPDQTYGPPDQTYGPPDARPSGGDELPSAEAPREFAPHPDAEEFLPISQSARFVKRRRQKQNLIPIKLQLQPQPLQPQVKPQTLQLQPQIIVKPAALVSAPAPAPVISSVPVAVNGLPIQQYSYYVINEPFSYSAQFRTW